jgi:hypothetical protein
MNGIAYEAGRIGCVSSGGRPGYAGNGSGSFITISKTIENRSSGCSFHHQEIRSPLRLGSQKQSSWVRMSIYGGNPMAVSKRIVCSSAKMGNDSRGLS